MNTYPKLSITNSTAARSLLSSLAVALLGVLLSTVLVACACSSTSVQGNALVLALSAVLPLTDTDNTEEVSPPESTNSQGNIAQQPSSSQNEEMFSNNDDGFAKLLATLPFEYDEYYDNGNYEHWFIIDYGPLPDKPGKMAILITGKEFTDDIEAAKEFAIATTKTYILENGCNPDDFEIVYTYEPINNR